MPDSTPPPDLLRRANRIGLRTLRQRPQVVDQTREGEHVFEVRSVRLLLGTTSNHFNLSVPCSECGRDVAGPAVLSRTDLDISVVPALCPHCAEGARGAAAATSSPRASGTVRVLPASARGDFSGVGWMDVVNQPLEPAMARPTAEVVDTPEPLREPQSGREAALEAARAELHEGLAEARAAVASLSETTSARLAAMEAQLRLSLAGLAAEVEAHVTDLAGLAESAGAGRAALEQVMVSQQELIRSKDEINRRLAELAAKPPPEPDTTAVDALGERLDTTRREVAKALRVLTTSSEATAGRVAALEGEVPKALRMLTRSSEAAAKRVATLEGQIPKAVRELTTVVDAQQAAVAALAESVAADRDASQAEVAMARDEIAQLRATLAQVLTDTRREATVREQELKVAVSDLRAMVAALRSDLETSAHAQLDRLAAQVERHAALAASVETVAAAVQMGERRTHSLEQRVEDAVALLSERLNDQREELAKTVERELLRFDLGLRPGPVQGAATPGTGGNGRPAGSLLDSLDDQLRAVEDRLAKLATNGPA